MCLMRNLTSISRHIRNVDTLRLLPNTLGASSFSVTPRRYQHLKNIKPVIPAEDRHNFMSMFPAIIDDLMIYTDSYHPHPAPEWFARCIKYNVSHGKNHRGLFTLFAFNEIATEAQKTPENYRKALYLGWCAEILVGYILVLDDIVDGSETRRKQTCWYKLEDVGLQAINDCLMMENAIFHILEKYLSKTDYYVKLLDLFREVMFRTIIGQSLDYHAAKQNITTFTMDQYKIMVREKASFGTYAFPVIMAMHICGLTDEQTYTQSEKILCEIGEYFQSQNDFEDCYADSKATKRVGTDIEDNRCTWLAVKAVELANEKQLEILKECYGHNDPEKVNRVRAVYDELDMVNVYAKFEKDSYKRINEIVSTMSIAINPELFLRLWEETYLTKQPVLSKEKIIAV